MTYIIRPQAPLQKAVLFLVFNRPDNTAHVFEAIRKAKPPRLYVAADGPRFSCDGELERVAKVRELATAVDWPCEVRTLFREENLGCGPAVKTAIDWFFEHEFSGIILEDDTVPLQSFFWFCEEMLARYEDDNRIGMIAGTNHISNLIPGGASYQFSKNKACWGWATWRRAWKNMDFDMRWRANGCVNDVLANMGVTKWRFEHWKNALALIDKKIVNAWDWQWYFSIAIQNQLCVFPKCNLVRNIGFGDDSTHTQGSPKREYLIANELVFPLSHPMHVFPSFDYDKCFENKKIKPALNVRRFFPTWLKKIVMALVR